MQEQEAVNKLDRSKLYFLVIVIAALVGINVYLYVKDTQKSNKFVTVSTEKDRLALEVEKIEVELDKVNLLNVNLNDRLAGEQKLVREKIAALKLALKKGELTQGDLEDAQNQITQLREFVKNYNDKAIRLEQENSYLKNERDSLKSSASLYNAKAIDLEQQNQNLIEKVRAGAALKTSLIEIDAYRVKNNGRTILTTKASSANKITVKFAVTPNELAEKTFHTVYLRVFDPAGNVIAEDSKNFTANGQQMQYSDLITFSYNNDETVYKIDWVNPTEFIAGVYSVILYADGFVMGKSSIELK